MTGPLHRSGSTLEIHVLSRGRAENRTGPESLRVANDDSARIDAKRRFAKHLPRFLPTEACQTADAESSDRDRSQPWNELRMSDQGMNTMFRWNASGISIVLLMAMTAVGCRSTDCGSVADPALRYGATTEIQPVPAEAPGIIMPAPILAVPVWPGDADNLMFAWMEGTTVNLKKRGKARINAMGLMELSGGSFTAEGVNRQLLEACSQSNALTIEVVLRTDNKKQQGPARIVSFSTDHNSRNFTLGQDRDKLTLRLRTSKTGANGTPPETSLTKVEKNRRMHLIVTYRPGELVAFVDGKETLRTADLKGDFSTWTPHHLIFGDEFNGQRDWSGDLERVAIFSQFTTTEAAHKRYQLTTE